MNAKEYDILNPVYRNLINDTENVCRNNNVDYWNYKGSFVTYQISNYRRLKSKIKTIRNLDFSDKIKTRAVLNKAHYASKEYEEREAIKEFNLAKKDLFDWLDQTNDPYFFILNPVYEYGAGMSYTSYECEMYGYKKVWWTGVQNISIATDYANYLVSKKLNTRQNK